MYVPLIIIGAPRSGTNMLRDVLTSVDGIGTWPCDEINYIWRYGNVRAKSDVILPERANDNVVRYIRGKFDSLAASGSMSFVVEKTCANSLRVSYVDKIFPDAIYIYIVRNGFDAVASAVQRWHAPIDLRYVFAKARYVPALDIPYYGMTYLANHLRRLFSTEKRLAFWGPRFPGMDDALRMRSIEEVCALQWQVCVKTSDEFFSKISSDRVIRVRYEDFVKEPKFELDRICASIGTEALGEHVDKKIQDISAGHIGKWRNSLNSDVIKQLTTLVGDTMRKHGYSLD